MSENWRVYWNNWVVIISGYSNPYILCYRWILDGGRRKSWLRLGHVHKLCQGEGNQQNLAYRGKTVWMFDNNRLKMTKFMNIHFPAREKSLSEIQSPASSLASRSFIKNYKLHAKKPNSIFTQKNYHPV